MDSWYCFPFLTQVVQYPLISTNQDIDWDLIFFFLEFILFMFRKIKAVLDFFMASVLINKSLICTMKAKSNSKETSEVKRI